MVEDLGGEIAVGVDDPDSLAGLEVLGYEIAKEGTLAGAGLADEVQVVPAIATGKAEGRFSAPAMSKPHVNVVLSIHVPKQISPPMSALLLGVCKSVQALVR